MIRVKAFATITAFALSTLLSAQEQSSSPGKNMPVPKNDAVDVPYTGVVTALDKNSITIRGSGEKPKSFPVSDTLAAGEVPSVGRTIVGKNGRERSSAVGATSMYRLTDIKVGDWVVIGYAYLNEVSICDHVRILKRPGGLVPPLPAEAEALMHPVEIWKAANPGLPVPKTLKTLLYIPYHEEMNARWDLEDKGIPYPEKFGKYRQFPVAPPPRAVMEPRSANCNRSPQL